MTKLYYTIFNLVGLCVITYACVDIFYTIVRTQLTLGDARTIVTQQKPEDKKQQTPGGNGLKAIVSRNIFNTREQGAPGEAKTEEKEIATQTIEPTSLKVTLLGTVMGIGENSWAVIEETGKTGQGLYRVGDSVQDAVIKKILRGKVVFRVGDRDEILQIEKTAERSTGKPIAPPDAGGRRASTQPDETGRTIFVKRSDVESSLQDISGQLSGVRIIPHSKDGVADGLVITSIRADSIFRKMGLMNGDIVQGINGKPIENADDITSLISNLKSGSSISLQISRRGRPSTLNYQFRD